MAGETFDDAVAGGSSSGLITVARAQECEQLASVDAARLATLIDAASAAIVRHCGRSFVSEAFTDTYSGDGTTLLVLDHHPLISLTTITITDDNGTEYDIATDQFRLDLAAGLVYFKPDADDDYTWWPVGILNIEIVCVAGYATVPEDVQEACALTVAALLSSNTTDPNLQEESLGDYSFTRRAAAEAIPAEAKALLASYRDVGIA